MRIFEPHIHMFTRVTDDYERLAMAGVRAVLEPAFWIGQPRTTVGSFVDYFDTLIGWERFRASQFGVHHFCTMALNPREANDDRVNRAVVEMLPRWLEKDGVLGVGEIGLDDQTPTRGGDVRRAAAPRAGARAPRARPHAAPRQEARLRALHRAREGHRLPDGAPAARPRQRGDDPADARPRLRLGLLALPPDQDGRHPHGEDRPGVRRRPHGRQQRGRLGRLRPDDDPAARDRRSCAPASRPPTSTSSSGTTR